LIIFAQIFKKSKVGRRKKPVFEQVEIIDIAAEGNAIAKVDDMVVFTPMAIPGDIVDIRVHRKRKRYMEGQIIKFHKYSDLREEAKCKYFGVCGGCKWQQLPYDLQLKYKQKQVTDNLERIGKVELPEIKPILGSEEKYMYRNKLEFTFSNKRWLTSEEVKSEEEFERNALGFHIPKMFDKILDIDECHLQNDPSNEIRNFIRDFSLENNIPFFDIREHEGLLRTLIIRNSSIGEIMVIVTFFSEDTEKRELLMNAIAEKFPQITALMYVINPNPHDAISNCDVDLFKGKDHIVEEMEGLKFKVGPKSFYQTNSTQAYELYKITRDFAQLTGEEVVYDLYTGTGTIANFVARSAKTVVGVEYVPEAIEDAKINSEYNKIDNTLFFAGDMKDVLNADFIGTHGKPDVIITDPPRAGMHKDVVETILFAEPKKIVYVSCNPATQARDLELLSDKYKVEKVQPVDMFPHTHHVENVVLLSLI